MPKLYIDPSFIISDAITKYSGSHLRPSLQDTFDQPPLSNVKDAAGIEPYGEGHNVAGFLQQTMM